MATRDADEEETEASAEFDCSRPENDSGDSDIIHLDSKKLEAWTESRKL